MQIKNPTLASWVKSLILRLLRLGYLRTNSLKIYEELKIRVNHFKTFFYILLFF